MHLNTSPECEIDQFDDMMAFMFEETKPTHRHAIAIDLSGKIFRRAWVVAELVVVMILLQHLQQSFKAYDLESLKAVFDASIVLQSSDNSNASKEVSPSSGKRNPSRGINIWECEATNKDDAIMIQEKAKKLMEVTALTSEIFHRNLNDRIFQGLKQAQSDAELASKLHILCIGNAGVGTTTLINSMIGDQQIYRSCFSGGLHEQHGVDAVYLDCPGLADTRSRGDAAKAITLALRRDCEYKMFFAITLEAGRVRPEDTEMIKLVLESAAINGNYAIIVNKATHRIFDVFKHPGTLMTIKESLFSGIAPAANVYLVRKYDELRQLCLPPDLISCAPSLSLKSASVKSINGQSPHQAHARLQERYRDTQNDNAFLKKKLGDGLTDETYFSIFYKQVEGKRLTDHDRILWNCRQRIHTPNEFNKNMDKVALPSGLQSLTFGWSFNKSMEKVALPSGLQSLTFGMEFNQGMEKVALPSGLQSLTFGSLQSLTFGTTFLGIFNQSMEKVALPSGLQSLTFGGIFNQSMEKVALPSGLQSLTFGDAFDQSMEKVALPSGLQSLTFGEKFNQSMEKVALPSGLQSLTFGWEFNQSTKKVPRPKGCTWGKSEG